MAKVTQKQIMVNLFKEITKAHASLLYIASDFQYHLEKSVGLEGLTLDTVLDEKRDWFRENETDKDEWDEKSSVFRSLAQVYGASFSQVNAYLKLLMVPESLIISDSDKEAMAELKKLCGLN